MTAPDLLEDHQAAPGTDDHRTVAPDPAPVRHRSPRTVDGPVGQRPGRRTLQAALLALPVVVLAALAWTHRSMFLDGYIYLHVVQNVLAGHGPVFNAGQRVEAFTSPLWLGVLAAVGFATPFPLTSIAVDLGIAATVAGLGLATAASARLVRRVAPDAILVPLGAVVFVAVSPVWSLASMGLETGLEFLWLGSCLWILVRWAGAHGRTVPGSAAVVLGLGPLVRPELALDTLVFLAVVVAVDPGPRWLRHGTVSAAWAFALPLVYEVFRMGYYGMLVANTAVAKEASLPRPGEGVRYLTDFLTPYWLVIPAAALLLGAFVPLSAALRSRPGATRNRSALLALPVAALLNTGYITLMGGDYVHGRLLMAPFFAVCHAGGRRSPGPAVRTRPGGRPLGTGVRGVAEVGGQFAVVDRSLHRGERPRERGRRPGRLGHRHRAVHVAVGLGDVPPGGSRDAADAPHDGRGPRGRHADGGHLHWIGQGPYELGPPVRILDLLGLADPLTAHLQLTRRGLFPGHEKPLPTPWIAALVTAPGSSPAQLERLQEHRPAQYTPLLPATSGGARSRSRRPGPAPRSPAPRCTPSSSDPTGPSPSAPSGPISSTPRRRRRCGYRPTPRPPTTGSAVPGPRRRCVRPAADRALRIPRGGTTHRYG